MVLEQMVLAAIFTLDSFLLMADAAITRNAVLLKDFLQISDKATKILPNP